MTRMIERWFPCAEVSVAGTAGWGAGKAEKAVFPWFAARPPAQAKAAVICSLLPWPDDEVQQRRFQRLVQEAMTGRYVAWETLRREIQRSNPAGAGVLDPFSGRGMIPLEAARLGLPSYGVDYSPVAVLASHLLADYPFRDWSDEPLLPFARGSSTLVDNRSRLLVDVEAVLLEVRDRWSESMAQFYPEIEGKAPWGYLWAVTLPCQECGHRFPLVGSYALRQASIKRGRGGAPNIHDPGQSFYIQGDRETGRFSVVLHDGPPRQTPTLANALDASGKRIQGKSATCVHCGHTHPLKTHQRLASEGHGRDTLLDAADIDDKYGKWFRAPTEEERVAAVQARRALAAEPPFAPGVPARPDETIPLNSGATIRPQLYGASSYGDLMCDRQTLSFVRMAKLVSLLKKSFILPRGPCSGAESPVFGRFEPGSGPRSVRRRLFQQCPMALLAGPPRSHENGAVAWLTSTLPGAAERARSTV